MMGTKVVVDKEPFYICDKEDPCYAEQQVLKEVHETTQKILARHKQEIARDKQLIKEYKRKKREFKKRMNGSKLKHRLKLLFSWSY